MFIYLYAFFVLWFLNSFKDIFIKHSLKNIDSWVLAWITSLCLVILTLPFLYNDGLPKEFSPNFLWILLFGGVFYYFWKYFNFTSLSLWDISLISPMKWLVTLSSIATSFLLLWETVSIIWWLWLFLIVAWTYLLAIEKSHTKFLDPIKALWSNPWSKMYLICILFYWFTTTIDRMWTTWSSVWFWSVCMNFTVFIFSIPDILKHKKSFINNFRKIYISFFFIVLLHFVVQTSQYYVVSQILSPYTSAFKTSSALFAVIIGWWFFKEKWLLKRFISAVIVLAWVALVAFYH